MVLGITIIIMSRKTIISILVIIIVILSLGATLTGIITCLGSDGEEYEYESIRGDNVTIYGRGLYKHMSADVAIQGVAQDFVTLLLGIPLLLISLILFRKGSFMGKVLLAGTLGYFMVTYIFYLTMAMYNEMYLVWVLLASASFFGFLMTMLTFDLKGVNDRYGMNLPRRTLGIFLIINSILIGLLWLSVVVPPILDGSIYPDGLEHYTTLIVQGFDLSILLPASFLAGFLILKRSPYGYLLAPPYIVFLSILMTALVAKIIGMTITGVNPGPSIVIIPLINLISIVITVLTLRSVNSRIRSKHQSPDH